MTTPPPVPAMPPRAGTARPASPRGRQNQIIGAAIVVILIVLLLRACAGGENKYEKIAHQYTQAIQSGDLAAVTKLSNSGTAADLSRQRFGAATDALSPLGKIKKVSETTSKAAKPRIHEFDVLTERGTVHETYELDPDDKVYHFRYDPPVRNP